MGLGYFRQTRPVGRLTLRQRAACALFALWAIALPSAALAQSETAQADSQVGVLANGQIIAVYPMDFGKVVQPAVAGSVTMVPGTSTCTPSAGVVRSGTCQPARFAIKFRKHERTRIRQMNSGTIVLTGPGGATMTITNLSISVSDMTLQSGGGPPGTFGTYRIESDTGIAEFKIGGRLNVAANQSVGVYEGELIMNVLLN